MNFNDPYKVLGVSPDASDDEIKRAYKELVKKYHPDQYQDNPLADVAAEKMADINAAYDKIMTDRRSGGYSSSYNSYGYGNSYGSSSMFDSNRVRQLIQAGSITQAEQLLNNVEVSNRDAEWYFLMGSVFYKRGWLNDAYSHFSRAASMDPSNMEYASALNQMNRQRSGYMNGNPMPASSSAAGGMDCCTQLCCADCCCEMMGGDLIPCC